MKGPCNTPRARPVAGLARESLPTRPMCAVRTLPSFLSSFFAAALGLPAGTPAADTVKERQGPS